MSATTTLETLREALAGEHSQLESWVSESFAAMEILHGELSDWQRELTQQQALLDQRKAAVAKGGHATEGDAFARLEQELRELRRLVERQGSLLERLTDAALDGSQLSAEDAEDGTLDADDRAAELLRRASTRRAQRRAT
jgi:hypothetical protein